MAMSLPDRVSVLLPSGLGAVTRRAGRVADVGIVAGLGAGLVAGALGRVSMRVVALATPVQPGLVTENGALVGVITPGGTVFVVIAGAFLGLAAGLGYLAVRQWLPVGRWPRTLASGALSLCLGGGLIINAANPDFTRLGTPGLDIAVFAVSFVVAGMALSVGAEWLDRALPPTGPTDRSRVYLGVYAVVVIASVAFLFLAVIVALIPFWYLKAAEVAKQDGLPISLESGTRAWRIGRIVLASLAGLGLLRLSVEIATIFGTTA